ncbi:CaiB/BaiF CoA transferase family protein [Streptomyces atratus]|uniref:CaiB/BaiF CoA transferase family protein n=1 Tax=Streptomyces atratus TaxID=1893 RepID=UPI0033CC00B2
MTTTPYSGLRVVEIAEDPGGEFTGKLLAGSGADVVKVEPPHGSAGRRVGPFADDRRDPEASLSFHWYNAGKRSVILDDTSDDGRSALEELLTGADVLIVSLSPAQAAARDLVPSELVTRYPRLIVVALTPFGLDGPWSSYRGSDLVGLAAGGMLHSCGYDDHSLPPVRPGGDHAYTTAASFAHTGLLLALLERRRTGRGQVVDVSVHAACAVSGELSNPFWFYPKAIVKRQTSRHAQPSPTQPALFRCGDDHYVYFALILADQKPWQALVKWMDDMELAADLTDPAYDDLAYRQRNFAHVQELVEVFFLLLDSETAYHEGQRRGLPIGVARAPEELFDDEHLRARGFFVEVEQDEQTVSHPGTPYRFSAYDLPGPRRAPRLGEHTREVLERV